MNYRKIGKKLTKKGIMIVGAPGPGKADKLDLMESHRIPDWVRFLKDDNDFDFYHIIRVLRYKLERIREHIVTHRKRIDYKVVSAQIRAVTKLLDSAMEDSMINDHAQDDLKKAFNLMVKNIWHWWD